MNTQGINWILVNHMMNAFEYITLLSLSAKKRRQSIVPVNALGRGRRGKRLVAGRRGGRQHVDRVVAQVDVWKNVDLFKNSYFRTILDFWCVTSTPRLQPDETTAVGIVLWKAVRFGKDRRRCQI